MQRVTGTINPGGHPGSYNGQDAYNDLLVVDDGVFNATNRRIQDFRSGICSKRERLQRCDRPSYRGGTDNMKTVVRRLTPKECERLQGYDDDWTNIGEWVDSKGKKHQTADSARYKALGNSICLPFWFYLLRRISATYERPATLGSLFDGIGGFPLCWERCNGKGTAIWASEIEEFPIAVTKVHFPEPNAYCTQKVSESETTEEES